MQLVQIALPTIATVALGAALLVPLRDDRRGKRATFAAVGDAPLRPDFRAIASPLKDVSDAPVPISVAADASAAGEADSVNPVRRVTRRFAGWIAGLQLRRIATQPMTEPLLDSESDALQERLSFADRVALALPEADLRHRVAAFDIYDAAEDEPRPDVVPPPPAEHVPLVVHSQRPAYERAVPITRLPLRSQTNEITWSALADPSRLDATRSDRHALLAALPTGTAGTSAELLMLAYNEEDAAGRLLAMRALMRVDAGRGRQVFIEALRAGTDEERAFAIDALVASGAREALIPAFSDRVEAIAAKAALAFVGTNVRDDYQHALAPYIDEARIEALLALLAGYLI